MSAASDYYDDLLGRGLGDPDSHTPPWEQTPTVRHIVEPPDGLLSDMVNELDLTDDFKLKEGDEY